ncbi:MAG: hypothetical protein MI747_06635 [Desulfobacterales bacterium]|nr:hypothetical protein [Desulfobacterales bacterium]
MIWSESIKIQTSGPRADRQCLDYLTEVRRRTREVSQVSFRIFRHKDLPQQHMVWLEWDNPNSAMGCSDLSRELVYELKSFGLVDYSAWQFNRGQ